MWDWTKRDHASNEEQEALRSHPISDDFVYYAAHVAQAAALQEQEQTDDEPRTPPNGVPVTPDVLHIVIVTEPEPETSAPVVESTLAPTSDPSSQPTTGDLDASCGDQTPESLLFMNQRPSRRRLILWIGVGMSAALVLLAILLLVAPLILAAPVTVTLIPASSTLSTTMQVSLSTGSHPSPGSLRGRALPMLSLSETLTVPTTGIGHQPAEPGHGTVTFYNAAPEAQTISAGTLLTGNDGTQIVTDADAVIPAASFPTDGQISVPAQTVNVGPSGNITASDLYGACCREDVFVQNRAAFTGGQNARTYPMVTAHDIANVEGVLHPQLIASMKAAFLTHLAAGESLVTPFACREDVDTSAGIGDEATSLTLMLTDTCTAVAYQSQELATLVTQQLLVQEQHQLGNGYTLLGSITPTILNAISVRGKPNTQLLTVKATGTWAYQLSEQQIEQITRSIAGKSAGQATTILLHDQGISQVNVGTGGTLPADPARIHVLVIEQGS